MRRLWVTFGCRAPCAVFTLAVMSGQAVRVYPYPINLELRKASVIVVQRVANLLTAGRSRRRSVMKKKEQENRIEALGSCCSA